MFLNEVLEALESEKLSYALVGGMALVFHGIVRATMDVDVMIRVREADLRRVERALEAMGLASRIPVRAQDIAAFKDEFIERRNLIAWSFVDWARPSRAVDVMVKYDLRDFKVVRIKWGNLKVPVLTLEGLLRMKKEAGRAQDKADVEKIEAEISRRSESRKKR